MTTDPKPIRVWIYRNPKTGQLDTRNLFLDKEDTTSSYVECEIREVGKEQPPYLNELWGFPLADWLYLRDFITAQSNTADPRRFVDEMRERLGAQQPEPEPVPCVCGSSATIHSGSCGSVFIQCHGRFDPSLINCCWIGPNKPTRREAVEAWNAVMRAKK